MNARGCLRAGAGYWAVRWVWLDCRAGPAPRGAGGRDCVCVTGAKGWGQRAALTLRSLFPNLPFWPFPGCTGLGRNPPLSGQSAFKG